VSLRKINAVRAAFGIGVLQDAISSPATGSYVANCPETMAEGTPTLRSDIYTFLHYPSSVRRLLPLLACLMLMLTTMSGMAHAADVAGGSITGVELSAHTDGDSDEVPSDSDKGYPHHHTVCHGHEVGKPMQAGAAWAYIAPGMQAVASLIAPLNGTAGTVDLRPPQA